MEQIATLAKKVASKGRDLFSSKKSGNDYVNVPKEDENFTEDDYEFGGKGYMLDEENVNQDGGEDIAKNNDVDTKLKTSSLQASWNIGNLITGNMLILFNLI